MPSEFSLGFSKNQRIIDFYISQLYASIRLKKNVLPLIFLFCINLFSFFVFVRSANAINVSGEWVSSSGVRLKANQEGENFSLVVVEAYYPEWVGITELKGTIAGNTFSGQYYGVSQECPNLSGYVPASGTISDEKIEVKTDSFHYNPETCVRTRDYEGSDNFTRIASPTPTPNQDEIKQPTAKPEEASNEPTDQKNDNNKIASEAINDWILETFGPFKPYAEVVEVKSDTSKTSDDGFKSFFGDIIIADFKDRPPILKTAAGSIEATKLVDEMLGPRTKLDADENSLLITKPDGSTLWVKQEGDVIYYQRIDKRWYELNKGEIEAKTGQESIEFKTPSATIRTKGTHFFINHDPRKKATVVGVYEGEVEVIPNKGNKSVTTSPNGNKPGLVVVTQKLSVIKLAIVSLGVLAIVAVIVWFIKKKAARKLFKKRQR